MPTRDGLGGSLLTVRASRSRSHWAYTSGSGRTKSRCVWVEGWADIDLVDDGEGYSLCSEFIDGAGAYTAVVQSIEDLLV